MPRRQEASRHRRQLRQTAFVACLCLRCLACFRACSSRAASSTPSPKYRTRDGTSRQVQRATSSSSRGSAAICATRTSSTSSCSGSRRRSVRRWTDSSACFFCARGRSPPAGSAAHRTCVAATRRLLSAYRPQSTGRLLRATASKSPHICPREVRSASHAVGCRTRLACKARL